MYPNFPLLSSGLTALRPDPYHEAMNKPINWEWQYSRWLTHYKPWNELEDQHWQLHRTCWEGREIGAQLPVRHLTASAFVRHPDGQRVLVHRHPKLERWLQPGGHLEPGENPIAASMRELAEETGLDADLLPCILDLDVHFIPATGKLAAHDHVDARFLYIAREQELPEAPEGAPFRWMPWEQLAQVNPGDTGLARVVAKALSMLPGGAQG